jgi:hypothetical protein
MVINGWLQFNEQYIYNIYKQNMESRKILLDSGKK